jgi:3-oxoacyl-[acyl-carrier protein] reductase
MSGIEHTPATVRVGDVDVETWGARRFQDRIGVVTGAGSGIGKAVAERLIAEGATVYVLGRSGPELEATWAGVERAIPIPVDVGDSAQVRAAFARVDAEQGRLDVLCTSAGVPDAPWRLRPGQNADADLESIDDEAWDYVIRINLTGTFYCVRAAVPLIRKAGPRGGAIVTISSVGALAPYPLPAAYPASKAGVLGMTRAVAALLGGENIRINAVAPGATRTAMLPSDDGALSALIASQPIQRAVPPAEMASTIVYLLTEEAQFVTGQTVNPNGGLVM